MKQNPITAGLRSRLRLALASLAGAAVITGLAITPAAADPDCVEIHDVYITFEFTPKEITIKQGDCIYFENVHMIEHSAVGEEREFNSGILMPGGTAIVQFNDVKVMPYMCGVHPPMKALMIIESRDESQGNM